MPNELESFIKPGKMQSLPFCIKQDESSCSGLQPVITVLSSLRISSQVFQLSKFLQCFYHICNNLCVQKYVPFETAWKYATMERQELTSKEGGGCLAGKI